MTDRFIILRGLVAITDDSGKIPLFVTISCAAVVAGALHPLLTDPPVYALSSTSRQLAELCVMHGLTERDVYDFEVTATSAEDAIAWAQELATDAPPLRPGYRRGVSVSASLGGSETASATTREAQVNGWSGRCITDNHPTLRGLGPTVYPTV